MKEYEMNLQGWYEDSRHEIYKDEFCSLRVSYTRKDYKNCSYLRIEARLTDNAETKLFEKLAEVIGGSDTSYAHLYYLYIEGRISDKFAGNFANALKKNTIIECMCSAGAINNKVLMSVALALDKNSVLKYMNIGFASIPEEEAKCFADTLIKNNCMASINVSSYMSNHRKTIDFIKKYSKENKELQEAVPLFKEYGKKAVLLSEICQNYLRVTDLFKPILWHHSNLLGGEKAVSELSPDANNRFRNYIKAEQEERAVKGLGL